MADSCNHKIKLVKYPSGFVSLVAGSDSGVDDGSCIDAKFDGPRCLAYTADGVLLIGDYFNCLVRRIDSGVVSTFAGYSKVPLTGRAGHDGPARQACFESINAMALTHTGDLIVVENRLDQIRVVTETGLEPPLEFYTEQRKAAMVDVATAICQRTVGPCVRDFPDGYANTLDNALLIASGGEAARERGRKRLHDSKLYGVFSSVCCSVCCVSRTS